MAQQQQQQHEHESAVKKPINFSWLVAGKLAGMAFPHSVSHLNYLDGVGIGHLVTLSADMRPPVGHLSSYRRPMKWTLIAVREFEPPTVQQIRKFIGICKEAQQQKYAVGVHCRQGWGRTGVMLACYLVRFQAMSPHTAISTVRKLRPHSIETYEQERIVVAYNDYLYTTSTASASPSPSPPPPNSAASQQPNN